MYCPKIVYIVFSLTTIFVSIDGRNHYLDNLDLDNSLDQNENNQEKNIPHEKSYLEKLEEKTIYDNELQRLENLLRENEKEQQTNDELNEDGDDLLKESKVYPAFDFKKELTNQQQSNNEDDQLQSDNALEQSSDINQNEDNLVRQANRAGHYLTTMPTEMRNRLMSGPKLKRQPKKDPSLAEKPQGYLWSYPTYLYDPSSMKDYEVEDDQQSRRQDSMKSITDQETVTDAEDFNKDLNKDLNKEVDLEQLTKYLMAKRGKKVTGLRKPNSSPPINSEKDDSKESKEEKESKESKEEKESDEVNKGEMLPPSNYSTELKKTIITEQDGKEIKKVETYKKSVELSDKRSYDGFEPSFEDQSNSMLISQPINSNYENRHPSHQVNIESPIQLQQRNVASNRLEDPKSGYFSFKSDLHFIGIVVACSMISILSVIGAGYLVHRFQQHNKATQSVDYPAYGIIGPAFKSSQDDDVSPKEKKRSPLNQESLVSKATSINHQSILSQDASQNSSDRKLAQSAQMYHYHSQKQQMISTEKNKNCRNTSSDVESEEENEEGDYTVYECPGLSNLGEIEITNPNFQHEDVDTDNREKK